MSHPEDAQSFHSPTPRVVMYSRQGCHLCTDALDVVSRVCELAGESFSVVDIDTDPHLVAEYSDYVPVVKVDGVQQGFWRIDEFRLRRALNVPE